MSNKQNKNMPDVNFTNIILCSHLREHTNRTRKMIKIKIQTLFEQLRPTCINIIPW